jgi:hypothetical protein
MMTSSQHVYEVRPRKDKRGVDLISDALPFSQHSASLESFLKAKWQMMRRPKRSTIRTDVYEIRPRADNHGVDLVGDALPYSPIWYRGPKAITDAIDYAKFRSELRRSVIRIYDAAGNVIETHRRGFRDC